MTVSHTNIIDRRKNGKGKSSENRQKFLRRAKESIKKAVKEAIEKRSVGDILTDDGGKNTITIPSKGINEPHFVHGEGGDKTYILPGNHDKIVDDMIPKPSKDDGGSGYEGSPDGDGEDDFVFTLTQEEFLDFFFDELELPNLVKTQLKEIEHVKISRAGYTTTGMPANLSIIRSMKNALGRRIALQQIYIDQIKELEDELSKLKDDKKRKKILQEIEELKKKRDQIPFIDDIDIRYNSFVQNPSPITKAVMFCIMDVSGSMGDFEKDLSKRFFMLLYVFLQKHYKKIDIIFIRHHTQANECDEQEFFYDKETGGTIVSSALELLHKIIKDRYNSNDYNLYVAQASDGDNWIGDCKACEQLLHEKIIPLLQYFAYIQIGREKGYDPWSFAASFSSRKQLWTSYEKIANMHDNFVMTQIDETKDIYPVFRDLFKKKA